MFLVPLTCEDGQQIHLRFSIYGGIGFPFDLSLPCYVPNHDSFQFSFFLSLSSNCTQHLYTILQKFLLILNNLTSNTTFFMLEYNLNSFLN